MAERTSHAVLPPPVPPANSQQRKPVLKPVRTNPVGLDRARLEGVLAAGQLLFDTTSPWEPLDGLIRSILPGFADLAVVLVPDADKLQRVAGAHLDVSRNLALRRLIVDMPLTLRGNSPFHQALASGAPVIVQDLQTEKVRSWLDDERYTSIVDELGVTSVLVVPIESRGSLIGVLQLGRGPSASPFDVIDREIAIKTSMLIAVALERTMDSLRQQAVQDTLGRSACHSDLAEGDDGKPIQILVIDPFPVVRAGIRLLMQATSDIDVCGEAASIADAADSEWDPDVIVHELVLPDGDGPEVVSALRARFPRAHLVVLSRLTQPTYAHLALTAGAKGYLLKPSASSGLPDVIRLVVQGNEYVEPSLGASLARWKAIPRRHSLDAGRALTRREQEVLALIAVGYTNAEIATTLRVALRTVETHRAHLAQKLGTRSRAELVKRANELGERLPSPVG